MVAKRCKSGKSGFGTSRQWQAAAGVPGEEKAKPIVPPQTQASEPGRAPARARAAQDDPRARWAPDDPARLPGSRRQTARGHEVGETVARRSAMPVDLFPVDVNVCDTPILESLMERLGTLARGQGLDGLGIEHGVVEDLMADVEHRRLADEQNSRVRGKNSVDGGQGGIEPAGYIPAEEGQVPRPLVETGQGGCAVDEVADQSDREDCPAEDPPRPALGPVGTQSGQDGQAGK